MQIVCMKCQILFSRKSKKKIKVSSAEFAIAGYVKFNPACAFTKSDQNFRCCHERLNKHDLAIKTDWFVRPALIPIKLRISGTLA